MVQPVGVPKNYAHYGLKMSAFALMPGSDRFGVTMGKTETTAIGQTMNMQKCWLRASLTNETTH